jgi:hypothetical protein
MTKTVIRTDDAPKSWTGDIKRTVAVIAET